MRQVSWFASTPTTRPTQQRQIGNLRLEPETIDSNTLHFFWVVSVRLRLRQDAHHMGRTSHRTLRKEGNSFEAHSSHLHERAMQILIRTDQLERAKHRSILG